MTEREPRTARLGIRALLAGAAVLLAAGGLVTVAALAGDGDADGDGAEHVRPDEGSPTVTRTSAPPAAPEERTEPEPAHDDRRRDQRARDRDHGVRPRRALVTLRAGNVVVESLGARAEVPPPLRRELVERVEAFVRAASITPLRTGRAAPALATLFLPGALPPAGADRGAVSDERVPKASTGIELQAEPLTLTVWQDGAGHHLQAAATLDYTLVTEVRGRPLRLRRYGDLYFARDGAGRWRVSAYELVVQRQAGRGARRLPPAGEHGYLLASADGTVWGRGAARFRGSVSGAPLAARVVDVAPTPSGRGYWLAAADGGVFAFGDARFHGSAAGRAPGPVVAFAPTPSGRGYWLATADGGVFAFGDARHRGGLAGEPLRAPVVGMAATPTGGGYWLASADGGVFAFGDAGFHGSVAERALQGRIVEIAPTASGRGYWLAAADGGVFAFGDARFHGPRRALRPSAPITGFAPTASGRGYFLAGADGGVFTFGDAEFAGVAGERAPRDPIVAIAAPG